jgi:hypothetical protein
MAPKESPAKQPTGAAVETSKSNQAAPIVD